MTLEERVERLERFTGNIEKITSVYANSVQEICDKYLNLLYIETADANHPEMLILDGFLSDVEHLESIPHNVCFNVRASHNLSYKPGEPHTSLIKLKRGVFSQILSLKKYDIENPGTLKYLEPDDYVEGLMYSIYIDSQNVAVISSSDTGIIAYQEVQQTTARLNELIQTVAALTETQTVGSINVNTGTIANLTVSQALSISNAFAIPLGSTCSTPTENNHVANKSYVDTTIATAITNYHNNFHIFTTGDPDAALSGADERAICYKY